MSLWMGFLHDLTPVQGCSLDLKQDRQSETLGPHPGSQGSRQSGRGDVGAMASRVPAGLSRRCSAHSFHFKEVYTVHTSARHPFPYTSSAFLDGFSCHCCEPTSMGPLRSVSPSLLPASGFPSPHLQTPPQSPGSSLPTDLLTSREGLSGVQTRKGLPPSSGPI